TFSGGQRLEHGAVAELELDSHTAVRDAPSVCAALQLVLVAGEALVEEVGVLAGAAMVGAQAAAARGSIAVDVDVVVAEQGLQRPAPAKMTLDRRDDRGAVGALVARAVVTGDVGCEDALEQGPVAGVAGV